MIPHPDPLPKGEGDTEEILNTTEVSKILGVTPQSVSEWLKHGDFPRAYKLNPMRRKSAWRIPRGDVDGFIQKRRTLRGYFHMPVAS
jgi:predicted DNA-binding transcriptional regulator AlpA